MGKFDAGQCNGRTPERLEASHRGASAFDRSMILLDKIVKVLAAPHLNVLPLRILASQKSKGQMALLVAIECYFARPPQQASWQRFAEEGLRSGDTAIRAKQKIHRLAVLVDGPVEKIPLSANFDIRFIYAPGSIHGSCEAVPSLFELRYISNHPTMNRRVLHGNSPLGHHRHEISIAQPVGDVPADAQLDDFGIEAATSVNGISDGGPGHFGVSWTP
jgi:hypothetical protein